MSVSAEIAASSASRGVRGGVSGFQGLTSPARLSSATTGRAPGAAGLANASSFDPVAYIAAMRAAGATVDPCHALPRRQRFRRPVLCRRRAVADAYKADRRATEKILPRSALKGRAMTERSTWNGSPAGVRGAPRPSCRLGAAGKRQADSGCRDAGVRHWIHASNDEVCTTNGNSITGFEVTAFGDSFTI
jgi:hypothetical protein